MFKDKAMLIMNKIHGEEGNNKKKIENLITFIILLIVTIVFINYIWNGEKKTKSNTPSNTKVLAEENNEYKITEEDSMEKKLENILSKIKGVGEVKVLITYSQTSQIVPMYSENISQTTTEENDSRRRD